MSAYYCYLHLRPDKFGLDSVFYVGEGDENRIKKVPRRHNNHHTRVVSKVGEENVRVAAFPCISEDAAFELEKTLIKAFRTVGVKLCNQTDGGDGASGLVCSDETRAKLSAASKGRVHSAASKRKLSAAAKGNTRAAGKRNTQAVSNNQQAQREAPPRRDNTSGHKGVGWNARSQKWIPRITVDKKTIHLGSFATKEEAILARKAGEEKYWK